MAIDVWWPLTIEATVVPRSTEPADQFKRLLLLWRLLRETCSIRIYFLDPDSLLRRRILSR
jgi:hypothetical protein